MSRDDRHLRLLSLFHYVLGIMMALIACLFVPGTAYEFIRMALPGVVETDLGHPGFVTEAAFFLGGMCVLVGVLFATGLTGSGWFLAKRKHRVFCLVVAAMNCMLVPLGTILGVVTIIVLERPSVKELFQVN